MAKKKAELSARQQAFVTAYTGNATEAAIAAGYSPATARTSGYRLMKNADIVRAIKQRQDLTLKPNIATRGERQKFWSKTMLDPSADMKDRLRASELLGKSESDFIDRTELSGPAGEPIRVLGAEVTSEVLRAARAAQTTANAARDKVTVAKELFHADIISDFLDFNQAIQPGVKYLIHGASPNSPAKDGYFYVQVIGVLRWHCLSGSVALLKVWECLHADDKL